MHNFHCVCIMCNFVIFTSLSKLFYGVFVYKKIFNYMNIWNVFKQQYNSLNYLNFCPLQPRFHFCQKMKYGATLTKAYWVLTSITLFPAEQPWVYIVTINSLEHTLVKVLWQWGKERDYKKLQDMNHTWHYWIYISNMKYESVAHEDV